MSTSSKAFPLKNLGVSHPFFTADEPAEDKAKKIHRLLLDLSKDESEKELKSAARKAADFFRETFFGFTPAKIKSKIVECFKDYFDGEKYVPLELSNIAELTGIGEKDLLPVITNMVRKGEMLQGQRRRWNEAGEHYNAVYKPRR